MPLCAPPPRTPTTACKPEPAMNSRQRVLNTVAGRGYDRIPIKHEGTPEINRLLMDHLACRTWSNCSASSATTSATSSPSIAVQNCEHSPTAAWRAISANATSTPSLNPAGTSKHAICRLPAFTAWKTSTARTFPPPIGSTIRPFGGRPSGFATRGLPSAAARPETWT